MRAINILALALIPFLFASCDRGGSGRVESNKVFTEYRIVYDAAQDKSFARATFRFSNALGSAFELSNPATITFNEEALTFNSATSNYEREFSGILAEGTFSYVDLENNQFANTVSLLGTVEIPVIDTISQDSSLTLTWIGGPLVPNETMIVTIDGPENNDTQVFTTNIEGATSVVLSQSRLQEIGVGQARLTVERWQKQDLQSGTDSGGRVWSNFMAEAINIQIKA